VAVDEILQQLLNGIMTGSIYALVGLGLTMTFGLLDILNFAHGQMLMLGAYATFFLVQAGVPFLPAVVLAMGGVALLGAVMERVFFRPVRATPINGLIVSIGLIAVIENVALLAWGADPKEVRPPLLGAVQVGGVSLILQRVLVLLITLGLIALFSLFLRSSTLGKWIRATAQNREAAALMGIPTDRVIAVSFALGSALAAACGGLLATLFPFDPFVGEVPVLKGVMVIILGGLGSPAGAILGGLLLGVTEALGAGLISSAFRDGFGFVILILALLWRPQGLLAPGRAH
jgi:branched-chain amino acid transport system permease protein